MPTPISCIYPSSRFVPLFRAIKSHSSFLKTALGYLALTLIEASFIPSSAEAQISPDGTLSTQVQQTQNIFEITGGVTAGGNLFHSFEQFSVPTNSTAYFNNAPDIQNVISRVTGALTSQIDGLIQTNSSANLFLINPNGIVFGPDARLEVGGSFVATTASRITFADGLQFGTSTADTPPLLTVSVPVGLLFTQRPGNIQVHNSFMSTSQNSTLALVGGDVSLDGAILVGAGGRIELGGLVDTGTVALDQSSSYLRLRFPEAVQRGNVTLTNRSSVGATLQNAEGVAITAHNIDILGRSTLNARIAPEYVPPGTTLGDITLNATGSVTIDGQIFSLVLPNLSDSRNSAEELGNSAGNITIHAVGDISLQNFSILMSYVFPGAVGRGGTIDLRARSLSAMRSFISARVDGQGESGQINIQVEETTNLHGTSLSTQSQTEATAGNIQIDTGKLIVQEGAAISSQTLGSGQGGTLTVNASESVELIGRTAATLSPTALPTRLLATTSNTGKGGNLTINTPNLLVRDGAQVNVSTLSTAANAGQGGILTVNAAQVELSGVSLDGRFKSGLLAESRGGGDAGTLKISADQLSVRDGAEAVVSSLGTGSAGQLQVQAKTVTLNNQGQLTAETQTSKGGNIELQQLESLVLDNNSQISTSTRSGVGGRLVVDAAARIELGGGSRLSAEATENGTAGQLALTTGELLIRDGSAVSTSTTGEGNAGNLEVQANSLFLTNNSKITSRSTGEGLAGNIFLSLVDQLQADNGEISATSALSAGGDINLSASNIQLRRSRISSTVESEANGDGGDITIHSHSLTLNEGSQISASTLGRGNAGNIQLNAVDSVRIAGFDANGDSSGVFTSTSASGKGGNITVNTNRFQIAEQGVLNAATSNVGSGGKITVNSQTFEATSGAQLLATTAGEGDAGNIRVNTAESTTLVAAQLLTSTAGDSTGDGGNIHIDTNNLSLWAGALISAQSEGMGRAGNITMNARQGLSTHNSQITAQALQAGGGDINIQADSLSLRNGSLISTSVANSNGGGGDITIHSNTFIALEDSDILANADQGSGGNITINSPVFLADLFSNNQATAVGKNPGDFTQFRGNNRVDISASSRVGISGSVNIPDFSFLQNSLDTLSADFITPEQLIAGSCLARRNVQQGRFTITGRGGLESTPYESISSRYDVVGIQPVGSGGEVSLMSGSQSSISAIHDSKSIDAQASSHRVIQNWKLGDPIQEAEGITRTDEGRIVAGTVPQLVAITNAQKLICYDNPK